MHSAYITTRALRCVQVALIETQLTRMRDEAQRHATQAQHAQAEAEQRSSEHQAHVSRAAPSQSFIWPLCGMRFVKPKQQWLQG